MQLTSVAPLLSLAALAIAGNPWSDNHGGRPIYVKAGGSIQAAISSAPPKAKIIISPGTYSEQLLITPAQSGLTLVGLAGATLVPPASYGNNICTGLAGPTTTGDQTQVGICVAGDGLALDTFVAEHRKVLSVKTRVAGITITGLTINGFSGPNIALVGAVNAKVTSTNLINGGYYGCLSDGSIGSTISNNVLRSEGELRFISICVDDISGAKVTNNNLDGTYIGLCIQTPGAVLTGNTITNTCIGAYVDPGVKGAQLKGNSVSTTSPMCNFADNPIGVAGIFVSGAIGTTVTRNVVQGITAYGGKFPLDVGIGVADDDTQTPVAVASNNVVKGNTLKHNDLDLLLYSNGTGNVFAGNQCATSFPAGFCGGA
jgi:hypothetical protein